MTINTFRDLIVWQKSMRLVSLVYQVSQAFPHAELFGLTSQIRRSAVSIPSNIAEGHGRGSRREYLRSLRISMGSLCELDTQVLIARDLNYLAVETSLLEHIRESERMLSSLIRKLNRPAS